MLKISGYPLLRIVIIVFIFFPQVYPTQRIQSCCRRSGTFVWPKLMRGVNGKISCLVGSISCPGQWTKKFDQISEVKKERFEAYPPVDVVFPFACGKALRCMAEQVNLVEDRLGMAQLWRS